MISAPITTDEKERLQALYGYNILDTEAEKVFDDLTLLASEICETPIALISLIDPNRQWFKAKVGIDAEETGREIAFCAHAIHESDIFEIVDASKDERFFDNPLVTGGPKIRFYAGAQLVTPSGYAIGTLCTISDKPNKLTERQRNALTILSREVISQMELRKNLKQAEIANNFKTEFLSSMSHEIRTPLNAIIGFSQICLEKSQTMHLPAEFKGYLEDIDFSSQHLLGIINSVLDLSKIEAGQMEINNSWFRLNTFIAKICTMLQVKADDKGIDLSFTVDKELPEYLYLDERKLSQTLINLLNNSIKFTSSGKKITLSANLNVQALEIIVEDQGIGIAKHEQTHLFNKFKQVGNAHSEGTGLGLSITKSLVELMQGEIHLSSELNLGTTVNIIIPINNPALPEELITPIPTTESVNNQELISPEILIVEDNAINRKLANLMFNSIGHQVDFAEDGEISLQKVDSKNYDIIFMDIHMPGINGVEAAKQIRNKHPHIPIIALTADVFEIQKKGPDSFNFSAYLSKPMLKDDLIQTLKDIMQT
ncbi:MAG: ATP-binding protein [Thalassotalea sp.]